MTVSRLIRYEVKEICWLSGIENFVSEGDDFIFVSFRNFKPVKIFRNRNDELECWSLDNGEQEHSGCVGHDLFICFILCYLMILYSKYKKYNISNQDSKKYINTYVRQRSNLTPAITQVKSQFYNLWQKCHIQTHAIRHA